MMNALEQMAAQYLKTLWGNSSRYFKIEGLILSLKLMSGTRKVTFFFFSAFLSCMFLTASIFSALVYNITRPAPVFDLFNIILLVISTFSLAYLLWNLSEKRWIDAFDLQKNLVRLTEEKVTPPPIPKEASFNENDFEEILEQLIEKKLSRLQMSHKYDKENILH